MATNGRKPTVISLFAGTGGSSLGYKWAGFKEFLAIDFDAHAVECFRLNFPEVPVWKKDITHVTGKQILDFCQIKKGELDVLDGSPPCQGFSTVGRRQVNDPRNDLFQHYFRFVQEIEPKIFVMENVTGMVKGKMRGRFIEIMNKLKSLDYFVSCKQMNAMHYRVPQSRERLIFIGTRKDLKIEPILLYPQPTPEIISVGIIRGVKNDEPLIPIPDTSIGRMLKKLKPGENASKYHPKGNMFGHCRLSFNKPAPTFTKTGLFGNHPKFIHPTESRQITIKEAKILCSFPESFQLGTDFVKAWNRLGNAVMPKFMQAIAEMIRDKIT